MKTLCKNNVSIYSFEDTKPVSLNTNNITVGDPVDLTISDCSASDTTLYTDVTTADWTTYRQALRDVPAQSGFPANVTWPVEPS